MNYYAFFLTVEESLDPRMKGIQYALRNRSKWVDIAAIKDEYNTYDKGTTCVFYNGRAYNVYKDYVCLDEEYRLYICADMNLSSDTEECLKSLYPEEFKVEEKSDESTSDEEKDVDAEVVTETK